MVFEGSIPTCTCFHSENFFVTFVCTSACRSTTECFTHASKELMKTSSLFTAGQFGISVVMWVACGYIANSRFGVTFIKQELSPTVLALFSENLPLVKWEFAHCCWRLVPAPIPLLFLEALCVGDGGLVCAVKYRGLGLYCNKHCCTAGKIHHVYLTERLRVLLTASNSRHCIACTYLIQPSLMSAGFPMKYTPPSIVAAVSNRNTVGLFLLR